MNEKEFTKVALDKNIKIFIIYITSLSLKIIVIIYLA